MNISDAAKKSELPVKTIRYYAEIGLVKETGRTASGYRTYDETAVKRLILSGALVNLVLASHKQKNCLHYTVMKNVLVQK